MSSTLKREKPFWFSHLEGVLEFERPGVLAPSSVRDLASIGTFFETFALEVVHSALCVDNIRGEPGTWLDSV